MVSTCVWENALFFYAELLGILDSLSLLHGKYCERVLMQTDSLEVFEALQDFNSKCSHSALIRLIRKLLDILKRCKIDHIWNKEPDQTTKMTFDREKRLQLFVESPFVSF